MSANNQTLKPADARHYIEQEDLTNAFKYLKNVQQWNSLWIRRAIRMYRDFLYLCYLHPQETLVPSREIDQVGQAHRLHEDAYRTFCHTVFARFKDPLLPYQPLADESDLQTLEDQQHTELLYRLEFGYSMLRWSDDY